MQETLTDLKSQLDKYVKIYETKDFIESDPVRFIHRFKDIDDIEIAGFLSALFAYGRRQAFIDKLHYIFSLMDNKPLDYIKSADFSNIKNCDYRFSKNVDLIQILHILSKLYNQNETLQTLFLYGYKNSSDIWLMFQYVIDYFYSQITLDVTQGFYHLLPNPKKKSALKRMNMMLRWFVRSGCVDIGIWKFIDKSELFIPLDTHVGKIARKLGLLSRKDNGRESVIEITKNLRLFDSSDPIKYDYALFGYGVNNPL